MPTTELLAPAGNWDCVRAAAANGADAVYFGLSRFNARMRADNFTETDLPEVVAWCRARGVKTYVAFNTLVFTDELEAAADYLRLLSRSGVDGVIVQDVGLALMARRIVPDLPLHASTQMTVTSPEGAALARRELGVSRVVLARELSLRDLEKFPETEGLELEVFVHGALCVAYSGQCLTSEALGRRSANRGECAQACRLPYMLVVDGALRDLGPRRYLLSPQDLAAVNEIPALLERGVTSFKIEGRLKSPEYVAAVTQVYRKALDAAMGRPGWTASKADRYQLEMAFSRGLFTGWVHGVDHQRLVAARFGKKRGALLGEVGYVGRDFVELADLQTPVKPGDGVAFETGGDPDHEQGGRVYQVRGRRLFFQHGHVDFAVLGPGNRVWKTNDPALDGELKKSFAARIESRHREPVALRVSGKVGEPLALEARLNGGAPMRAASQILLQAARTAPLTPEKLREHLGRFGDAPFALASLQNDLEGAVILPIGELNRLRRELTAQLEATVAPPARREQATSVVYLLARLPKAAAPAPEPVLSVLCRTEEQLEAALESGVETVYLDFEDLRRYAAAVSMARARSNAAVFLATPRIQKAGEHGFLKLIEKAGADGVLLRNLGTIDHFRESPLRKRGDFSLNVANPLTAEFFMSKGLEKVTVSYDLNVDQALALLRSAPAAWFELTLHQHMPMFHMEHCVFAAFLSGGHSHLDCGRPCESHRVHLRDRVGIRHPLRADAGCRNTLFNAVAQTGAPFYDDLLATGLRAFRVELLEESADETRRIVAAYRGLLGGDQSGRDLWRELQAQSQLGVTQGTYQG